jgi:hypothetical protein
MHSAMTSYVLYLFLISRRQDSAVEFLGFRSGVVEVSVLLKFGAATLGAWYPKFRDHYLVLNCCSQIT